MGNVNITVVGNPATGPWGANATTTNTQNVMAHVRLDGVLQYVENSAPYDFFPDLYGKGTHTVEFVFYLQGTTSEIGRASITVMEGSSAPSAPATGGVKLTVVGNPATGPWGVNATTTNTQDVMAYVRLDGVLQYVENTAPYDLFPNLYGTGHHTVEFVFYLQGTTSEIGRASITVMEGNPAPSAPATRAVKLTVVGNPATGPWGVNATTTNTQDVMAHVRLDGVLHHVENTAPYDFFPKLYGKGHPYGGVRVLPAKHHVRDREGQHHCEGRGLTRVSPPPLPTIGAVSLTIVCNAATGPKHRPHSSIVVPVGRGLHHLSSQKR